MAGKLRLPGKAILAGVAALALPAMLELVTRADLSWALLAILALLPVLLAAAGCSKVICSRALVFPHTLRALSATYTFVFAAVVLAGVLITPYSAYGVWFETLRDGEPHGVVSTLIVLVGAVFSSWLGRRMIEGELLLPLYGELLVAAGLLALVRQTPRLQIGLLCLLGLGAVVLSVRFVRGRDRLRNLGTLLFLFLVVASVSGLPLLSARPRGSRIVDERLHPGLRQAVVALFPRFPLLYGIPGFGYGFDSKRLGGTPILSDAPVFEVEGGRGETLYLRTATYDTYDGRSWSRSPAEAVLFDRSRSGAEPGAGLAAGLAQWGRLLVLSDGPGPASPVRITVRAEYYSLVPFTLETERIYLPPAQLAGASGSFAAGYELSDPLRAGQSVLLDLGSPEETGAAFPATPGADGPGSEGAADRWLQLPGPLSSRLRELAALLADPAGDRLATLGNIERYLAAHCTYNLEAHGAPVRADFVDAFLFETREGYCVHFATSFAVLARLNGIPTRYATGFLVSGAAGSVPFDGPRGTGRRTVTGLSSHAWPEVWLEGRGWVAREATTAVNLSYYDERADRWRYQGGRAENRLTDRQLQAILGKELVSPKRPGQRRHLPNPRLLLAAGPAAALLAALLWALRRFGALLLAWVRPDRRSALRVVAKIVSSRFGYGAGSPERCGWRRWFEGAFPGSAGRRPAAGRLLQVIEEMMYADRRMRKRDVRFLCSFYRRRCLPRRARSSLSRG